MRTLRLLCLGLLLLGGPVAAEPAALTLTPAQMRVAAAVSVSEGRNAQALRLTDALLQRDPEDVDALVSRARALRNLGEFAAAQEAARNAHRLAQDDLARYAAAMSMAQALASDGKRTRAQLWLRRAAQAAPSDAAARTVARDYRYVARRNPFQVQFSFGIAPTDNVNNGSRHESMFLDLGDLTLEVPFEANAMPLSGTEASAGITLRRRLSESDSHALHGHLHMEGRSYRLSSEAKAQDPTARGSDYAFASLGAGLRLMTGAPQTPLEWRGSVERATYGGELYADILRLGTQRALRLPGAGARIGIGAEHLYRHDLDEEATSLELSADLMRPLERGGRLTFSLGSRLSQSDSTVLDSHTLRAGVAYDMAQPVLGSDLRVDMSLRWLDHSAYPNTVDGRQDLGATLGATAVLQDMTLYGFNPTVRVEHRVTDSNLRRQDTAETRLSFGFRSAF